MGMGMGMGSSSNRNSSDMVDGGDSGSGIGSGADSRRIVAGLFSIGYLVEADELEFAEWIVSLNNLLLENGVGVEGGVEGIVFNALNLQYEEDKMAESWPDICASWNSIAGRELTPLYNGGHNICYLNAILQILVDLKISGKNLIPNGNAPVPDSPAVSQAIVNCLRSFLDDNSNVHKHFEVIETLTENIDGFQLNIHGDASEALTHILSAVIDYNGSNTPNEFSFKAGDTRTAECSECHHQSFLTVSQVYTILQVPFSKSPGGRTFEQLLK